MRLLKKIDPHFMNMMKNANNTTKTKLLTLLCKELKDSNESIAITNHYLLSSQSPPSLLFFLDLSPALQAAPGAVLHSGMGNGGWMKVPTDFSKKGKRTPGKDGRVDDRNVLNVPLLLLLEEESVKEKFLKSVVRGHDCTWPLPSEKWEKHFFARTVLSWQCR